MSNESATKESNSRLQSVTRNVEEGNILDLFESEKLSRRVMTGQGNMLRRLYLR